jgi:hypothetical protein
MDRAYQEKARQFLSQTNRWLSELSSAATELMFLQRMLDIYGLKSSDTEHESTVAGLRKKIVGILENLNRTMPDKLHAHTDHLTKIVEDRLLLEDRELPYRHSELEIAMQKLRSDFGRTQQEAFALIETLKRF